MWIIDPLRIDLWGFNQCNVLWEARVGKSLELRNRKNRKECSRFKMCPLLFTPCFKMDKTKQCII